MNRQITTQDVLYQLYNMFIMRGVPDYIRYDNGNECAAHAVREYLAKVLVKILIIEAGSP